MDAIVLAGGGEGNLGKEICPDGCRALTPLCGKPMVNYVIEALFDSKRIDRVLLVGDVDALSPLYGDDPRISVLPSGGSLLENAMIAMAETKGLTVIATMDIPLITGEVVRTFIEQCDAQPGYEFYYPVIAQEINERAYPMAKRTYFKMAEGKYTGGNIVMIDAAMAMKNKDRIESLITHRKSAVKMAFDVGLWTLIKMAAGKLPLSEAEYKVCRSLDIKGKAIVSYTPEIGLDVDKPSDWDTAVQFLAQ